ncbi:MAG: hypothetical protein HFJ30_10360 [Clostridia bacterium]|jgi:hypothetical protein|nr:hypothetical protein [Clostridia bacterium]
MNKQETTQIITLLAGNYDSIAKKDKIQKQLMINTWYECLNDLDYKLVLQAVKKTIIESPYPPTIHDVRKNAINMIKPTIARTAIEAWEEAYRMICGGGYMTQEQFEEYSPEVRSFFGNVRQVKELSQCDTDTVNTVVKGQFLKQYEILVSREEKQKLLPQQMQNFIQEVANNMDMKRIANREQTENKNE